MHKDQNTALSHHLFEGFNFPVNLSVTVKFMSDLIASLCGLLLR